MAPTDPMVAQVAARLSSTQQGFLSVVAQREYYQALTVWDFEAAMELARPPYGVLTFIQASGYFTVSALGAAVLVYAQAHPSRGR